MHEVMSWEWTYSDMWCLDHSWEVNSMAGVV